jgi:hypothetical protein
VERLTLRNGNVGVGRGGAINNSGTLTLIDCILTGNLAAVGGGVFNSNGGTVTIARTTFDGNSTPVIGGQEGGGLSNGFAFFEEGGTVTIANSTFRSQHCKRWWRSA